MRKLKDLTPADFPGIDALKFEEWKQAVADANRNLGYFWLAFLALAVILFLAFQVIAFPGIVVLLLAMWLINRKGNRLFKELGLTRPTLREAMKRPGPPAP